jgi:hypothetical protein
MSIHQETKLAPRVAAGTKDADRNFMHKECITLQLRPVNQLLCIETARFWAIAARLRAS